MWIFRIIIVIANWVRPFHFSVRKLFMRWWRRPNGKCELRECQSSRQGTTYRVKTYSLIDWLFGRFLPKMSTLRLEKRTKWNAIWTRWKEERTKKGKAEKHMFFSFLFFFASRFLISSCLPVVRQLTGSLDVFHFDVCMCVCEWFPRSRVVLSAERWEKKNQRQQTEWNVNVAPLKASFFDDINNEEGFLSLFHRDSTDHQSVCLSVPWAILSESPFPRGHKGIHRCVDICQIAKTAMNVRDDRLNSHHQHQQECRKNA